MGRPFTRILNWGRAYTNLKRYLQINRNEMLGQPRTTARRMIAEYERMLVDPRALSLSG